MIVYTVAPRDSRGRSAGTQGDSTVYTDRRKRPLGAVSGHLCTLLRCEGHAGGRGDAGGHNSVHRLAKAVFRRHSGPFVYTVAARGSRGRPVVTQGDAIVYTDRRNRPLGAVLGHLCTLLRCEGRAGGRRGRRGTQQCTQIAENDLSEPFRGICVHCCDAGVARAAGGDAIVYTDWRKRPHGAVLGHLCTLLRRGGRADVRW